MKQKTPVQQLMAAGKRYNQLIDEYIELRKQGLPPPAWSLKNPGSTPPQEPPPQKLRSNKSSKETEWVWASHTEWLSRPAIDYSQWKLRAQYESPRLTAEMPRARDASREQPQNNTAPISANEESTVDGSAIPPRSAEPYSTKSSTRAQSEKSPPEHGLRGASLVGEPLMRPGNTLLRLIVAWTVALMFLAVLGQPDPLMNDGRFTEISVRAVVMTWIGGTGLLYLWSTLTRAWRRRTWIVSALIAAASIVIDIVG